MNTVSYLLKCKNCFLSHHLKYGWGGPTVAGKHVLYSPFTKSKTVWCAGSSASAVNVVYLWFWRGASCCETSLYTNKSLVYKLCTPVSSIQEWTTYFSWKPCNYCIFHYLYIWHEHLTWWWPEGWREKCVINSCMTDTVINNSVNNIQYLYP